MILLQDHKAVFVSVPKCGTKTMYRVLKSEYGGRRVGPGFHPTAIPPKCADWFTFTVVRNPYDRAVSLWWSTCRRDPQRDRYGFREGCVGAGHDPDTLEGFLSWLVEARPCRASLGPCIAEHLRGVRVHRVLKLEHLASDVRTLPFWRESKALPRVNPTIHQREPSDHYLTDAAVDLVNQWAAEDFKRFEYLKRKGAAA